MPDLKFTPITPHIQKLDLPFFGGRVPVGVWLVKHDAGWTVIDAGAPGFEEEVIKQVLAATGGQPPTRLLFTHGHGDHGAAAERMYKQWGMPLAAGRAEIPYILGPDRYRNIPGGWIGHKLAQFSAPALVGRNVQLPLDEGNVVDGMEVYHAPGHAPGMIALLHRADRALITGDVFMNINDKLGEPMRLFTYDPALNRESMRKLSRLDFDHLLPSHGLPIMKNGKSRALDVVSQLKK